LSGTHRKAATLSLFHFSWLLSRMLLLRPAVGRFRLCQRRRPAARVAGLLGVSFFPTAGIASIPAGRVMWCQRLLWPTRSHWSRPHTRLLCAAQRTFASLLTSQHFEQLLPTRGNHRLQSPGYLCPPRARSSVCRQIVSGKNFRLSHVRPEMQPWGALPRGSTENSTGPPAPRCAFRKGLRQPAAESPALPPGVYWEKRRR